MNATTASGFLVLAEADHSIDALYHAFRSAEFPAIVGYRSMLISVPAAAVIASSWLEFDNANAPVPTTIALWSSDFANSSVICDGEPIAPAF